MNRKRDNTFVKLYSDYVTVYGEKKYEECMDVFARIDLKSNYRTYTVHVIDLLRTASCALNVIKSPKPHFNVALANGIRDVFEENATGVNYEKCWVILSRFVHNLEKMVSLISTIDQKDFDLSVWLRSIGTSLFAVLKKAQIVDDENHTLRKQIYLELTQTLLIFVYAEAQRASASNGSWAFSESREFLANCQQYHLFQEGESIKQYNSCFKLLDKFLATMGLEIDNGKLMKGISSFINDIKLLNKAKELRATLTQDNYITLAKILKACEIRFTKTIDSNNAGSYFDLFGHINYASMDMKTEKAFCTNCDTIGIHCANEMAMIAMETYSTLIDNGSSVTAETIEKFSTIIRSSLKAICKLKCAKAPETQNITTYKLALLSKKCDTKEKAEFMIQPLTDIWQRFHQFKQLERDKRFDELTIASYLFSAVNKTENWESLVNVSYLYMMQLILGEKTHTFEHVAWILAKRLKENKMVITPFDHFKKVKTMIELPKNFDVNKVSLEFLRVGFKYCVMAPELSNKIIHQMLMLATPDNSSSLRFALFAPNMKFDQITSERVDKLTKALLTKSKEDKSIALQLAAIKYLRFSFEATELSESHISLSMTESLSEQKLILENNIFRKVTLDFEKEKVDTLRYVKKRYFNFTMFYIEKSSDERKIFDDEKELLLRDLKVIASQFIVRGYADDGLDLYMAFFKLSKEVNDEFGLIDSCSFLIENMSDFKRKFPNESFDVIIETVNSVALAKCKEMKTLSPRKQVQLCFCLLNLVLYYYEVGGDHSKSINVILLFVFNAIGGIGDKTMENSMAAIVGKVVTNAEEPIDSRQNFQNEAIRIKFYSVLFTMVTKFGAPSAFHPSDFINFVMNHVKKYMSLCYDMNSSIPIMMYNIIPQMVLWLEGRYEFTADCVSLMMTLLKVSLKYGYALKSVNLLVILIQVDLLSEKLPGCKTKFIALESMMLTKATSVEECKRMENAVFHVDTNNRLCEPIRKHASSTSPMKCLSPKKVTQGSLTTSSIKYLPKHRTGCECGICFNPLNHLQLFCVAVAYARFIYLNNKEFELREMRSVFTELLEYWENNRKDKAKKFPKNNLYYIVSARMFMYLGHFQWKYEKNYTLAKELLSRGLKGLDKVKRDAHSMKHDLKHQIEKMADDPLMTEVQIPREELYRNVMFISRKKKIEVEASTEMKKPRAPAKTKRINLLDLINNEPAPLYGSFQIHDDDDNDDDDGAKFSTPSVKKSLRSWAKKADETPIRTPSTRPKARELEFLPKTAEKQRPRVRRNCGPNHLVPDIAIDLTTPPETSEDAVSNGKPIPDTPIAPKSPKKTRERK